MPDDTTATATSASAGATDTASAGADTAQPTPAADSGGPITGGATTDMEDDFTSGFEPEEEEGAEPTEEVAEGEVAESTEKAEGEEATEEKAEPKEGEGDEAEERGKKILADRKTAADAAKAKEEAARAKATEAASTAQRATQFFTKADDNTVKYFNSLVTDYLPEGALKIGESEVNLREFAKDNPEVVAIAGVIANNHLQQLVNLGLVPTTKTVDANVAKVVESKLFDFAVLQVHPDANELMDTPEYKEFYGKAPAAIKALFDTDNPRDFITGLNKFKGAKAAPAPAAAPAKKAETGLRKKAHDTLHSSTLRTGIRRAVSRPIPQPAVVRVDGVEDEFAGAFNDAAVK